MIMRGVRQLSELVAELLLRLHDRLQLDEDGRRHMEEVVLGVQLLVVFPEFTATLTELVNGLLHLSPFEILQPLCVPTGALRLPVDRVVALELK